MAPAVADSATHPRSASQPTGLLVSGDLGTRDVIRVLPNAVAMQRHGVPFEGGAQNRAPRLVPHVEHADRHTWKRQRRRAYRRFQLVEFLFRRPTLAADGGITQEPNE